MIQSWFDRMIPFNRKEQTVIKYLGKHISYNWLQNCIDRIAKEISMIPCQSKQMGAIVLDRSPEMIAAIMAMLQMKITFVPIDPNFPKERIAWMIQDAQVDFIVSQSKYQPLCDGIPSCFLDQPCTEETIGDDSKFGENHLAYVAYTSGTSGNPKGVMVTRKGLFNFIEGLAKRIPFEGVHRIACFTTISFDIFFVESIAALFYGWEIVLASEEEKDNPRRMAKLLTEEKIEVLQLTPSRLQLLYNYDAQLESLQSVKILMVGGEPFPDSLLKCLQQKTNAKIYNMYGPTECTIWATVSELTHKEHADIGMPLPNIGVWVVDDVLRPVPTGQIGELCLSGVCLAAGYHKQQALTARSFCPLPENGTFLYRTGDYVRFLPSGDLDYIGRKDNQIKLHGYRIELEEIEHNLQCHPAIERAIALAEGTEEQKAIVLTYSRLKKKEVCDHELRLWLKDRIPEYMLPARYVEIQRYPFTANGKVDRKALESLIKKKKPEECESHAPASCYEQEIWNAIQSVRNQSDGSAPAEATLMELGIDSLSFIRIAVHLEEALGFEFEDRMLDYRLFETVRELSDYVSNQLKK
ncbi:MAG: non-ribosomal peptide synthetase [Clostridiales bacterium]|nr:non-ribosomal peptide synthetase [Clostridiales bacterium]